MRPHVAFLHTSPVHVATFERLVAALDPDILVEHVVDENLLARAQRDGVDDAALVRDVHAAMAAAAGNGAAVVICTCSTIGGAAEKTPPGDGFTVARIDRAMADRAVQLGPRILVVAAIDSTLRPTMQLIGESASRAGAKLVFEPLLVDGAWAHFLRGDEAAYLDTLAAAIRSDTRPVDVVVLAQASMAPVADRLHDLGIEVLSSPVLGVQRLLQFLREGGG